jgi:hypothetical protein
MTTINNNPNPKQQDNTKNNQNISETPIWEIKANSWEKQQKDYQKSTWKIVKLVGAGERFLGGFSLGFISFTNSLHYGASAIWKIVTIAFHRDIKDIGNTIGKSFFSFLEAVYSPYWLAYDSSGLIAKHNTWFPETWKIAKEDYDKLLDEKNSLTTELTNKNNEITNKGREIQNKNTEILNKTNDINTKAQEIIDKQNEIENLKKNQNNNQNNLNNNQNNNNNEENLKKENEDLKKKIKKLEDDKLLKLNDENEIIKLKKNNDELNDQLKKINQLHILTENKYINELNEHIQTNKNEKYKLECQIEDLTIELDYYKNKLDNKNSEKDKREIDINKTNEENEDMLNSLIQKEPTISRKQVSTFYNKFNIFAKQLKERQESKIVTQLGKGDKEAKQLDAERIAILLREKYATSKNEGELSTLDIQEETEREKNTIAPTYSWNDEWVYGESQDDILNKILNEAKKSNPESTNEINNNQDNLIGFIKQFINEDLIRSNVVKEFINTRLNIESDLDNKLSICQESLNLPVETDFRWSQDKKHLLVQQRVLVELLLNGKPTGLSSEIVIARVVRLNRDRKIFDFQIHLSDFDFKEFYQASSEFGLEFKKYESAITSIRKGFLKDLRIDLSNFKNHSKLKKTDLHSIKEYFYKKVNFDPEKLSETPSFEEQICLVLKPLTEPVNENSNWYYIKKEFILKLRSLIESKEFKEELDKKIINQNYNAAIDVILNIVLLRFLNPEMQANNESAISKCFDIGAKKAGKKLENNAILEEKLKTIDKTFSDKDVISRMWEIFDAVAGKTKGYDPQLENNDPYLNFTSTINGVDRTAIRMGSPTIDDGYTTSSINSEYDLFVTIVTRILNQKMIYFNLQDSNSVKEGSRFGTISKITEQNDNFFHLGIPQDTEFYKQEESTIGKVLGYFNFGTNSVKIETFKNSYSENLWGENHTYDFSKQFNGEKFQNEICVINKKNISKNLDEDDLFNDVLRLLYPNIPVLNPSDCRVFIDIFDAFLELKILKDTKAQFFNISCKEGVDRAGKNKALLSLLIIALLGKLDDEKIMKDWETITLGPCVSIKSRGITNNDNRRERLINAVNRLKSNDLQDVLNKNGGALRKALCKKYGITDESLPKLPHHEKNRKKHAIDLDCNFDEILKNLNEKN